MEHKRTTNRFMKALETTEQPSQELMIVKTVESLLSVVNHNLGKLDKLAAGSTKHKVLVRKAFEEIDLFEKTTLFDLQKAFE